MATRFCAATFLYVPFEGAEELRHPWRFWFHRVTYPLPFLALLVLLASANWRPLSSGQWVVIAVYVLYLFPYVVISHYDRYKFLLLGLEVVLLVWGIARIGQLWTSIRTPVLALEEDS